MTFASSMWGSLRRYAPVAGAGALGSLTVLLVVLTLRWGATLGWLDRHSGLAGWVQGVGSVAAILSAIWIARGEARDRSARAVDELRRRAREQHALICFAEALANEAVQAIDHFVVATDTFGRLLQANEEAALARVIAASEAIQGFPIDRLEVDRAINMLGVVTRALTNVRSSISTPSEVQTLLKTSSSESAHRAQRVLQFLSLRPLADIEEALRGGRYLWEGPDHFPDSAAAAEG